MRKLWVLAFLILLSFSASAFPASANQVDSAASPDDPAVIEVNVQNSYENVRTFKVGTFSPQPSWIYVEQSKKLQPGENGSIRVTVTPGEYAIDNTYSMTLYVKASGTDHSHKIQSSFSVERDRKIILEDFSLENTTYDPGDTVKGALKIRSISSQVLKEYKARFSYGNQSTTETSSPILPGGTRTLSFSMPVDREASPGIREVAAEIILRDAKVGAASENFTVNEIRKIKVDSSNRNNVLSMTGTVTVVNLGNAPVNYTVNRTVSSYLAPITGFSKLPETHSSQGSSERYSWTVRLEPGEEFTLKRHTNYWIPAAALLGIIAALAGIKKLRNSIKITKEAEKTSQGLKISIDVENISDRTFRNVEIDDFVPDIAEVEKSFDMAAPTVRKTNEGTKLSWEIDKLEPGDQRVLQYTIRPKVEVEGGVELQAAELKEGDEVIKKTSKLDVEFNPE